MKKCLCVVQGDGKDHPEYRLGQRPYPIKPLVGGGSFGGPSGVPGGLCDLDRFQFSLQRLDSYRVAGAPGAIALQHSKAHPDIRRGLEEEERELVTFIDAARPPSRRPVQVVLVATKLDKEPRSARKTALHRLEAKIGRKVIGFSSVTAEGRDELWRAVRRAALGAPLEAEPETPTAPVEAGASPQTPAEPVDQNG